MLTTEPAVPFQQYRARRSNKLVWALRMPEDFRIQVARGRLDQRKAGAKQVVQYVSVLEGAEGDFLVLRDDETGERVVYPQSTFVRLYNDQPESGG